MLIEPCTVSARWRKRFSPVRLTVTEHMLMQRFFLMSHAFLCLVDNHVVFLDLKEDRYWCLDRARSSALCAVLGLSLRSDPGNVRSSQDGSSNEKSGTEESTVVVAETIKALIEQGLLTADGADGKDALPVTIDMPSLDLGVDFGRRPVIRLRDLGWFLIAAARVALGLRWDSIENIIRRMERRKLHHHADEHNSSGQIEDLIAVYKTLRPWMFTGKGHCLFDSLAMIEFLASYGIYPTLVFGVKMHPFVAHCWLQHENIVVNDNVDHVTFYTPIMAV